MCFGVRGSTALILLALFLALSYASQQQSEVPRKVWVFWFGKAMEGARKEAYESLVRNIGVEVELVTIKNIHQYNVTSHPFHKAIQFPLGKGLSAIHVGDYLRVYFMHHYGGGYHDVKRHGVADSWVSFFDIIENDPKIWVTKFYTIYCSKNCFSCSALRKGVLEVLPVTSLTYLGSPNVMLFEVLMRLRMPKIWISSRRIRNNAVP